MFSPLDESPHESFYNIENNEQQQHTPSVATFLVVPIFSQYQIFYVRCLTCVCYKSGALFCVDANIGGIKACHKKLRTISFTPRFYAISALAVFKKENGKKASGRAGRFACHLR